MPSLEDVSTTPCGYRWCGRQIDPEDRTTVLARPPDADPDALLTAFCCPHHVPASWVIVERNRP